MGVKRQGKHLFLLAVKFKSSEWTGLREKRLRLRVNLITSNNEKHNVYANDYEKENLLKCMSGGADKHAFSAAVRWQKCLL